MNEGLEESIEEIQVEAYKFTCPLCDKKFTRLQREALESNINNHMKARHEGD